MEYVAVIRVRETSPQSLPTALQHLKTVAAGVSSVIMDRPASAVHVAFNRAAVSLGDLVRTLEDVGIVVSGVAQHRADVGRDVRSVA